METTTKKEVVGMRKMTAEEERKHRKIVNFLAKFDDFESRIDGMMERLHADAAAAGISPQLVEEYRSKLVKDTLLARV